jgi:mannose-6-phosphate isomerase-like protein (cupin superfamily)
MFLTNLQSAESWFEVMQTTDRSQTAVMNLDPGQSSGDSKEAHPESDQVLIVLDGEVLAEVADESARMCKGDVVVIPAGVSHRFVNQGGTTARTFSVYAPPAYPPTGEN